MKRRSFRGRNASQRRTPLQGIAVADGLRPLTPGYGESLQTLAIRTGALSYIGAKSTTGTIYSNLAYLGGVGAELLVDPGIENWTTPTNATDWSEFLQGTTTINQETSDVHGGSNAVRWDIDGSSTASLFYQNVLPSVGDTLRFSAWVKGLSGGELIRLVRSGGSEAFATLTDAYAFYTKDTIISASGGLGWQNHTGPGSSIYLDDASIKKISELDVAVGGTTTMGVAGKQGQRAGVLGADIITNGGFDADTAWSKGPGWSIGSGVATHTPGTSGALTQSSILTAGQTYKVTFTVSGRTAGSVSLFMAAVNQLLVTSDGEYEIDVIADGVSFALSANSTFDGSVDNVAVKPYSTPHAVRLDGSTSKMTMTGTKVDGLTNMTVALQFYGFTSGLHGKYLLHKNGEYTISLTGSGNLEVQRNRATTNAKATTINTVSELAWHELVVTIDENGYIDIWVDKNLEPTGVAGDTIGSGAFTSNTNSIYWGSNSTVSNVMNGVLDEGGIWDRVLSDREIANWFQAVTGDSYSTPTLASFLAHMDSLTGVDVRGWDFSNDGSYGAIAYETVHSATQPDAPGSEEIAHGSFDAWTGSPPTDVPTGWSVAGQTANHYVTDATNACRFISTDAGQVQIYQDVLTSGRAYKLTLNITSLASGSLLVKFIGSTLATYTTPGQKTLYFVANDPTTPARVIFLNSAANCDFTITDVSIVELNELGGEITGTTVQDLAGKAGELAGVLGSNIVLNSDFSSGLTGWTPFVTGSATITDNGDGTVTLNTPVADYAELYQSLRLAKGQSYRIKVVVEGTPSGQLSVRSSSGGTTFGTITTAGTHYLYGVASHTTLSLICSSSDNFIISEVTAEPYTTPSAVLADGATSSIAASMGAEFHLPDDLSIFALYNAFGYGEGSNGRVIEKSGDYILVLTSSGWFVYVGYATTPVNETLTGLVATLNTWESIGVAYDSTSQIVHGVLNGDTYDDSAAGSGAKTGSAGNTYMLNRSAGDRTWDGVMDLIVAVSGVALSPHTFKRLHDFAFGIAH